MYSGLKTFLILHICTKLKCSTVLAYSVSDLLLSFKVPVYFNKVISEASSCLRSRNVRRFTEKQLSTNSTTSTCKFVASISTKREQTIKKTFRFTLHSHLFITCANLNVSYTTSTHTFLLINNINHSVF